MSIGCPLTRIETMLEVHRSQICILSVYGMMLQLTEPHQPGLNFFFLLNLHLTDTLLQHQADNKCSASACGMNKQVLTGRTGEALLKDTILQLTPHDGKGI